MPKHNKIEKTETGYTVHYDDMIVGVGAEQAKTEKQALEVAAKVYDEAMETKKQAGGL